MAQTMTPSRNKSMTDEQIEKLIDTIRGALRRHREQFRSDLVQRVLGTNNLGEVMISPFRQRVEILSKMIIRRVRVDRTRSSQAALDATGRKQYTNKDVVASMPRGEGEEVDVYFFDLDYDPTPTELDKEYEKRNLKADPIAQAQVNTDDPSFADDRPNGCQWGLTNGVASFVALSGWHDERRVHVYCSGDRWYQDCRFGGVRK